MTGASGNSETSVRSTPLRVPLDDAAAEFREVTLGEDFPLFFTIPAYAKDLVEQDASPVAVAGSARPSGLRRGGGRGDGGPS